MAGIGGPSEILVNIFDDTPETLSPKERYQLIAVSNKYGYTFAGTNSACVKVIKTDDLARISEENQDIVGCTVVDYSHEKLTVADKPLHISINCDESVLSVVTKSGNPLKLQLFDLLTVCKQGSSSRPLVTAGLTKEGEIDLIDLLWNPVLASLFAICLSDGSANLWVWGEGRIVNLSSLPKVIQANAACWSPRGIQIVIGTADGTLMQFTHSMELKKTVPKPDFTNEAVKVVDILWLSTYMWVVAYIDEEETIQPNIVIVNAPKERPASFINFEDICYGSGEDRKAKYYMKFLNKWGLMIAFQSNAMDAGVLGQRSDDKTSWDIWTLDDSGRIELPLCNDEDTFPMGFGVDFTSQRQFLTVSKQKHGPVPIVLIISSEGLLCLFHVVNQEATESLQQRAQPLPAGGPSQQTVGCYNMTNLRELLVQLDSLSSDLRSMAVQDGNAEVPSDTAGQLQDIIRKLQGIRGAVKTMSKQKHGPVPIVLIISSEGLLCLFHVVNQEATESLQQRAQPLPAGGPSQRTVGCYNMTNLSELLVQLDSLSSDLRSMAVQDGNAEVPSDTAEQLQDIIRKLQGIRGSVKTMNPSLASTAPQSTVQPAPSMALASVPQTTIAAQAAVSSRPLQPSTQRPSSTPGSTVQPAATAAAPFSFKPLHSSTGQAGFPLGSSTLGSCLGSSTFGASGTKITSHPTASGSDTDVKPFSFAAPATPSTTGQRAPGTSGALPFTKPAATPSAGQPGSCATAALQSKPFLFILPGRNIGSGSSRTQNTRGASTFSFTEPAATKLSQPADGTPTSGSATAGATQLKPFSFASPQTAAAAGSLGQTTSGAPSFSFAKPASASTGQPSGTSPPFSFAKPSMSPTGSTRVPPMGLFGMPSPAQETGAPTFSFAKPAGTVARPTNTGTTSAQGSVPGSFWFGKQQAQTVQPTVTTQRTAPVTAPTTQPPKYQAPVSGSYARGLGNQGAPPVRMLPFSFTEEPQQGQSSQATLPEVQDATKSSPSLSVTIPLQQREGAMQTAQKKPLGTSEGPSVAEQGTAAAQTSFGEMFGQYVMHRDDPSGYQPLSVWLEEWRGGSDIRGVEKVTKKGPSGSFESPAPAPFSFKVPSEPTSSTSAFSAGSTGIGLTSPPTSTFEESAQSSGTPESSASGSGFKLPSTVGLSFGSLSQPAAPTGITSSTTKTTAPFVFQSLSINTNSNADNAPDSMVSDSNLGDEAASTAANKPESQLNPSHSEFSFRGGVQQFSFGSPSQTKQTGFSVGSQGSDPASSTASKLTGPVFGATPVKDTTPAFRGFFSKPSDSDRKGNGDGKESSSAFAKSDQFSVRLDVDNVASSPPKSEDKAAVESPGLNRSGEDYQSDERDNLYLEPVVTLPEVVNLETGEEGDDVKFTHRAKLYRWDTEGKQWKERGVGDIKVLFNPETKKHRIVMRRDQVLMVCANHLITELVELQPNAGFDRSWVWNAMDVSEGEVSNEKLAVRFKTMDAAKEFKEAVNAAKKET